MYRFLILLSVFALGACANRSADNPQYYHGNCDSNAEVTGTLLGAVAGGAIGYGVSDGSALATGLGAAGGAVAGNVVGRNIDKRDCHDHPVEAQKRALSAPVGDVVEWRNHTSGASGTARSLSEYQTVAPQPQQCREFTQTVTIAGRQEQMYGTACLQPDGTWKIIQ